MHTQEKILQVITSYVSQGCVNIIPPVSCEGVWGGNIRAGHIPSEG
jgi:hypothetical protein